MTGVNDRFGHHVGDQLLRSVAARLDDLIGDRGKVARTSGDEFAVLLPGVEDRPAAQTFGRQLSSVFDPPCAVAGGGSVRLKARIGIALTRDADRTATGLLRDADVALAETRRGERGIALRDGVLREREQRRLTLKHELTTSVVLEQFQVVFQPLVDLSSGRAVGLETLLRWTQPDYGRVGPEECIPPAEQTGAIVEIGAWVLQQACGQLASWSSEPWAACTSRSTSPHGSCWTSPFRARSRRRCSAAVWRRSDCGWRSPSRRSRRCAPCSSTG
ncbi:MAG: diguanylate cyclase domain-containing protein [Nitriliruptoraceae bacterium]